MVHYFIRKWLSCEDTCKVYTREPVKALKKNQSSQPSFCATFFGTLLGGPKPFPKISPKKTTFGFFFAVIGVIILGYTYLTIFKQYYSFVVIKLILISLIAIAGDLIESKFKRQYKLKHTGTVFKIKDGVFDRLDSCLALSTIIIL